MHSALQLSGLTQISEVLAEHTVPVLSLWMPNCSGKGSKDDVHIDGLCLCPEGSEAEELHINTLIQHSVPASETTQFPSGEGRTAFSPQSH